MSLAVLCLHCTVELASEVARLQSVASCPNKGINLISEFVSRVTRTVQRTA